MTSSRQQTLAEEDGCPSWAAPSLGMADHLQKEPQSLSLPVLCPFALRLCSFSIKVQRLFFHVDLGSGFGHVTCFDANQRHEIICMLGFPFLCLFGTLKLPR